MFLLGSLPHAGLRVLPYLSCDLSTDEEAGGLRDCFDKF